MNCPNCGSQLAEGSTFCAYCGSQIGQAQAPVYNQPVQQAAYAQPAKKFPTAALIAIIVAVLAIVAVVVFVVVKPGKDDEKSGNKVDGTYVLTRMEYQGVVYEGADLVGTDSTFVVEGDDAYMTNGSQKEPCSFELEGNDITIVDAIGETFYGTYDEKAKTITLDIGGIIMEYTLED